ncbi:hypothetical protein CsSME_00040670 [Camellia sinensis var. sinensis]
MSLTTPSSSLTSEITTLPNPTITMELQTSTISNPLPSMASSKSNCCPLPFATKCSTSEPTPNPPTTTPSTPRNNTHEHTL